MRVAFDAFLGLFFLMALIIGGVSIIDGAITIRNADATKTGYVAQIENSNFAPSILRAILDDQDYDTSLTLYRDDGGVEVVNTASGISDTSTVYMVKLEIEFDYRFALFNSVTDSTLIAYAR